MSNKHTIVEMSKRNYSIDLCWIIAIYMVLILHINLFGGFPGSRGNRVYTVTND